MFVNEKDVMLEAGIEMSLEAKLTDDRIVVAVYMSINSIHSFENLSDHARK